MVIGLAAPSRADLPESGRPGDLEEAGDSTDGRAQVLVGDLKGLHRMGGEPVPPAGLTRLGVPDQAGDGITVEGRRRGRRGARLQPVSSTARPVTSGASPSRGQARSRATASAR
jgi:hypothetical protein